MTAARSLVLLAALTLLLALVGLAALVGGLWFWSADSSSLATTLGQVAHWLPAGQSLETRQVTGSLRHGGRIGWLRWQQAGLAVEARDVQFDWQPASLWQQELWLGQLSLGHLRIEDQRPARPDTLPLPPAQLALPIKISASIRIDQLEWVSGSTSQSFDKLAFNYSFNSYEHRLDKGYIDILSNKYEFAGQLQAQAPMALSFKASGMVNSPVPGSTVPLKVLAQAELDGQLASADARLALHATLTPQGFGAPTGRSASKMPAMQARLSAQLAPWQVQQIITAQGQWQALNLASLWPQTPQTLLDGALSVRPDGPGWQASIQLKNALSGPLDQQRLPLQTLKAEFGFAQGQWRVQSLQADMAGGRVLASGQFNPDAAAAERWKMQASVTAVNTAGLYSPLAPVLIGGTLSARQLAQGVGFDINLQASRDKLPDPATAPASSPTTGKRPGLQFQSVLAQGLWQAPLLTLNRLRIDAPDAHLQGQLSYHAENQGARGQIGLSLPGLQSTLDGHLSGTAGQGQLAVQVQDVAATSRWLSRWPAVASLLGGYQLHGAATLAARWQGGWQNNAQGLQIESHLRATQLGWTQGADAAGKKAGSGRLRVVELDLAGTPGSFSLSSRGGIDAAEQQLDWQAKAQAGRATDGHWQASIGQLELALRQHSDNPPWMIRLGGEAGDRPAPPVTLNWQTTGLASSLSVSGGTARLLGPAAGSARLNWQPLRWTQAAGATAAAARPPAQWQSQGSIDAVPLAWLDAVSQKTLADLGLGGDLQLSGNWDATYTDSLHLRAMLERSGGDLHLTTDVGQQRVLLAGMAEARLQVNLDGAQVSGSLRWDSVRAGRALMAFSTELQQGSNGWALASNAPVAASLQLKLPPMDAWSALAPPGWRLRGTMDADVTLTGTRDAPHWSGSLQARDLALRSVVDGLDFNGGSLLATFNGQQLDIQNFTLQGAGGASGGTLGMTGTIFWPAGQADAGFAQQVRMQLAAQARQLRLSSRPDRRITVSGQLSAELANARLGLRGALKADSALFTLPDYTTPQLGEDVVVRGATGPNQPVGPPAARRKAAASPPRISPDLQVELDLGTDFQVRGQGVVTRLAGKLTLAAKDIAAPSLTGTLRTVEGSYQAYGQRLEIERGLLRFSGPPDNPALAVLAIRPKLSQRVGVQIRGTALSPIVQLYADPDLPEAEKLGWLVLGRSPSGSGAEAALMQQAALALLDRNGKGLTDGLTQSLGLDELSFSGGSSTDADSSAASITLGKRLSKDFYIAYESSLNGAIGVIHIFYDLTRNLTLRAETGGQSAIDLIYTLRYD